MPGLECPRALPDVLYRYTIRHHVRMRKKKFHSTQTNTVYSTTRSKTESNAVSRISCYSPTDIFHFTYDFMQWDRLWQHEPAVLLLSYASGFSVFLLSFVFENDRAVKQSSPHSVLAFAELFISEFCGILSHGLIKGHIFLLESCLA